MSHTHIAPLRKQDPSREGAVELPNISANRWRGPLRGTLNQSMSSGTGREAQTRHAERAQVWYDACGAEPPDLRIPPTSVWKQTFKPPARIHMPDAM